MQIYSRKKDGVVVLTIIGDLDVNSSELIEVVGWHVRNNRVDILCDFTSVNLIDHQGISALTIAHKNVMNHKGRMKLCNLPVHIKNLIYSVCLNEVFEVYDSKESALESFKEDKVISEIKRRPLRRRFGRLQMDLPVEFKSSASRDDEFLMGKLFNLSGVGAFILAHKTFAVGETLTLHINLLSKPGMIETKARILWLIDKKTQPQLFPGMGVEFIDISSAKQKKILQFIERNAPTIKK